MKNIAFAVLTVVAGFQFGIAHAAEADAKQTPQAISVAQTHSSDAWQVSSNGIRHPLLDGEPQTGANWDYSSAHDVDGYAVPRS
ncbi:hypothetical protein AB4Y38_41480 [Paraburkholderia sp. EG285A]|uniref:hypothetical protein n=1 Tax=Paraburkholderia sp. EG285A TaxID=3237009 RepID=UPI0034D385E7